MTLAAESLSVRYGSRVALEPTSFALEAGQLVALIGPNGAGKSSLLKALAGLMPHTGTVTWRGAALASLDSRQRARSVAFLPQTPVLHWPMRVRDLIALGRLPHRAYGVGPTTADDEAVEWAMRESETSRYADRSADQLSVGERARVLLARALAVRAPVLLVDEPIAMLDPYHQLQIMTVLRDYAKNALVLAVLHDLALAARFCSRVLLVDNGAVVDDGRPELALSAAAVRKHYRVEPLITTHDGEPVIVPWRRLGSE